MKNFIDLLILIFFVCLVPILRVAFAADHFKEISNLGYFFHIPVAYVFLFIGCVILSVTLPRKM